MIRHLTGLIWNADELDNGILLSTWGLAVLLREQFDLSRFMTLVGLISIIVGIMKITLSTTRLAQVRSLYTVRVSLPVIAAMLWSGAAYTAVFSDGGGWSVILYLWLAYRAAKSHFRLITNYMVDVRADNSAASKSRLY